MVHTLPDGRTVPCATGGPRPCRICALIDRAGPDYRADYRRLFHPEEFPPEPVPEPARSAEPPGLVRKAINLGAAVAQHVAAGLPEADEATVRGRLFVCWGCVQRDGSTCLVCGCNVDVKARWLDQRCPIGLW